jgi:Protein of unknown function (DUF1571)
MRRLGHAWLGHVPKVCAKCLQAERAVNANVEPKHTSQHKSRSKLWVRPGARAGVMVVCAVVAIQSVCCADRRLEPASATVVAFRQVEPKTQAFAGAGVGDGGAVLGMETSPQDMLSEGLARYEKLVRDFTCVFWRQERIKGKLSPRQAINVAYRESPRTILMTWVRNAVQINRALYAEGRNLNGKGEPCAVVEPANRLVRLCAPKVTVPIHGWRARRSSRYAMDQFGFRMTLERISRVNRLAEEEGVLDLRHAGVDQVDGRPTYVLVRYLPYDDGGNGYPDAKLIVHIDQEWLLPLAIYAYADREGTVLLGSYVMTDVSLNTGLGDDAFTF